MTKELFEQRARLHGQMTAILDKAKAEKRQPTKEENEQFDRMDADIVALTENIARAEKLQARDQQMNALQLIHMENIGGSATQVDAGRAQQAAAYEAAFMKMLRVGEQRLSAEERNLVHAQFNPQGALSTTTGATGDFLVPTGFSNQLEDARKWFGGIAEVAETLVTESGAPLPWPSSNDTTNTGEIIGVNTQVSQAQPSFGNIVFSSYIFSSKLVLVPLALLQDSYFPLDTKLPMWLGMRLARIQNTKFTVGTGINEPTGLVTAAAAAGLVVQMATGNTATISVDNLTDLEFAVDKAYRPGAKYMFHDQTLKLIKKLKDSTGRSLWLPGLASTLSGGIPNTVNGYEYVINNDMPTPGASQYIVAFGDLTAFKIRRVKGNTAMRLTERYADYFQVGFLAGERADSNLVDAGTHPIALLQNSAT